MIDLHCHILPSLDDGAIDLPDALAMARAALDEHNLSVPPIVSRGGCSVHPSGGGVPAGLALALAFGLVFWRRRG